MLNNLLLRGKRYSVRLFIPADFQKELGRKEIVKSLGTGDKKHAKLLLRRIQYLMERLIFYSRMGLIEKHKLLPILQGHIENSLNERETQLSLDELRVHIRRGKGRKQRGQEEHSIRLQQAAQEWLEQKEAKGLKSGSMDMYRVNLELAVRFYGKNYPLKQLNNRELFRFVQHEQGRGVKNTTIVRRIRLVKDVIKLACANHGLPTHTYLIDLNDDSADILPLAASELDEMFKLLNEAKIKDWQYWCVLVALLAGLRREEVVSLRVKDVRQENGIWFFHITDSKTDAGIRFTPISPILKQLGFLEFHEKRQKTQDPFLFMCSLPAPRREYVSVPATKFGDFFKNLKCKFLSEGDLKVKRLHSLRHNYSDALKQGGIRPDIRDELCGHEHAPGSMRSIYDEKFGLDILANELERALWRCDFSLLRTWKEQVT